MKRLAEIIDTSSKDASRRRKVSRSPKMQEISADRGKGLSKNSGTVRRAIADRDGSATQKGR